MATISTSLRLLAESSTFHHIRDFLWDARVRLPTAVVPGHPGSNYLNLKPTAEYPLWRGFGKLSSLEHILVRQEYLDFIAYVEEASAGGNRLPVFLTGHQGIGKSLCIYYMLLHCLSVGKSVFFQGSRDYVHYFNEHGVYALTELGAGDITVSEALKNSWVLIDVDSPSWEPEPGGWLSSAPVVVMASPPDSARQSRFVNQFDGRVWIMKPWSYEELVIEAGLRGLSADTVAERYPYCGPVPRSIFQYTRPGKDSVTRAIRAISSSKRLVSGISSIELMSANDWAVLEQVFLISPTLEDDGTVERSQPAELSTLSPIIADMLARSIPEEHYIQRGLNACFGSYKFTAEDVADAIHVYNQWSPYC